MIFERTKNTKKSIFFGTVEKMISLFLPFIIRTIIIRKLGGDYAGLSSLFSSILTFLNISDLGFSSAIMFCLYRPIASDNHQEISALAKFLRNIYFCISAFILVAGLICMPFLKFLIHGSVPPDINLYLLFSIYLFNSCSSYIFGAYKITIVQAYQKQYIESAIRTTVEIVKSVVQIIILIFFANYYIYVLILPISTILINFLVSLFAKKRYPWCRPSGSISKESKKILRSKILFLMAHKIASSITNGVDSIVISLYLGLTMVTCYSNYSMVTSSVIGFLIVFYDALKPSVANQLITDKRDKCKQTFKGLLIGTQCVCIWCTVCLFCLFQPFITLWVGSKYLLPTNVVVIICLFFYSNVSRQFFSQVYIEALGLWDKTLWVQILSAILNLVLDLLLGHFFGVWGIVFASFASTAFISYPMDVFVVSKYVFHEKPWKHFTMLLLYAFVGFIICVATYRFCSIVAGNGYIPFVLQCICCLFFPSGLLAFVLLCTGGSDYLIRYLHLGKWKKKL